MRIYLLRHGQSQANAGISDTIDCSLTDLGKRQAEAVAEALSPVGVDVILSSPYRRCLETAELIRRRSGAAAEFWPAIGEHHHDPFPPGPWPLPSRDELLRRWPGFVAPPQMPQLRWATVPEDRAGQWSRISKAVRDLLNRFCDQANRGVVIVTHQAPASVFIQAFCQWNNPLNVRVQIDPGSLSVLRVDPTGRRHVICINCRAESLGDLAT